MISSSDLNLTPGFELIVWKKFLKRNTTLTWTKFLISYLAPLTLASSCCLSSRCSLFWALATSLNSPHIRLIRSNSVVSLLFFSALSTFSELSATGVVFEEKNQLLILVSFVSFCCAGPFCWAESPGVFLPGKCFVRDPSQLEDSRSFFSFLEIDDTSRIPGFTFVFFSHIVGEL